MFFCNRFSRTRHKIFLTIISQMITITQVSFFWKFHNSPTFPFIRDFYSISHYVFNFVSSSTIATPPHFNSSAGMKSKPETLLFARPLNPSSIPCLEISFIKISASSEASFISSSKSNKMEGTGWFRSSLKYLNHLAFCSSSERRTAPASFFIGIEVFGLDPVRSLIIL